MKLPRIGGFVVGEMNSKLEKSNEFFRKHLALFIMIMIFFVILTVIMSSYAFFTANVQGEGKQITLNTSNAIVNFTDTDEVNETGITPGTVVTKTFSITNTTKGSLQYKINWEYLTNNFTYRNCLKYTITSTGGGGVLSSTQVPDSDDHINIINNITLPGNTTQNYTMTITYEDNGQNQDADKNKSLIGKIEITNIEGTSIAPKTTTGTYTPPTTADSSVYGNTMGDMMKKLYPVGSIYTRTDNANPNDLFPGTTWERYGKGKTLVGLDENDTSFNTVGKTGGVKDAVIPYHRHDLNGSDAKAETNGLHTHDVSGSTSTNGAHTHTIAANGITVKSTAVTIESEGPNSGVYQDGVNYGEHTHSASGFGKNTSAYTISSSGAHTHTTTASTTNGGTADGGHYHTIAANQISVTNSAYTTGNNTNEGNHTHTTTAVSGLTTNSESAHTHTIAAADYANATSNPGTHKHISSADTSEPGPRSGGTWSTETVGGISNGSWEMPQIAESGSFSFSTGVTVSQNLSSGGHTHNVTLSAHSTGAGTAHSHTYTIPSLSVASSGAHAHTIPSRTLTSNNASAVTIPNTNSAHTHSIPALSVASSGSHSHSIAANAMSFALTNGTTSSDNHAGAHIHDINLPALTSKNANAITVPNTNSGHSHEVTGTATSGGAHEHTLGGYSQYAGTSGNVTNANLQPYITVYMWRRVS